MTRIGIKAAMGYRRGCQPKGKYGEFKFRYFSEWDAQERYYLCYRTTTAIGYKEEHEEIAR